jgi:hypothetical protein
MISSPTSNSFRNLYSLTYGNISISLTQAVYMNQYASVMTFQTFLFVLLACHMLYISCQDMSWSLNHGMPLAEYITKTQKVLL